MRSLEQQAEEIANSIASRYQSPQASMQSNDLDSQAESIVNSIIENNRRNSGFTIPQRAMQFAHGVASEAEELPQVVGKLVMSAVDPIVDPIITSITQGGSNVFGRGIRNPEEVMAGMQSEINAPISRPLSSLVEKVSGRELAPTDDDLTGRIIHGAGRIVTPFPFGPLGAGVKAGAAGAKAVIKALGKELAPAFGASTALEALPEFTEKGTAAHAGEDFAKVIIGSAAGSKLNRTANYLKNLASQPKMKDALEKSSSMPLDFAARQFAKVGKPNLRAMELAEKHDVQLPFNVGVNSSIRNFMANTAFKSMFTSKAYKKSLQEADESMVDAVNRSIDTLGRTDIAPHEASTEFQRFLKGEEKNYQKQSKELYKLAEDALKTAKPINPNHTVAAIHSIRDALTSDIKSPATKKVLNVLNELSSNWGVKAGMEKPHVGGVELPLSKDVQALMKGFQKKVEISPDRLNKVRQNIGEILKHDPDIKGKEALLYRMQNGISKDLEASSSDYSQRIKEANKFFKMNVADRFRNDIAMSLMTGQPPKDAYNLMSNVGNIKELEKIAGESTKGAEIFNSLKKAKVRSLIDAAVEGNLRTGKLRTAPFAKIFDKREPNQELLKRLLGKEEYNKLSEVAEISKVFSEQGRDLLNTSGTALTQADLNKVEKLTLGALSIIGIGTVPIATAIGGGAAAMSPFVLSKLMANKEFVRLSNHYAKARLAGKEKQAHGILKRLIPLTEREIRQFSLHELREEEE